MANELKTIVITGASSGIGKATAKLFTKAGWNVVAAMRQPDAETELVETATLKLVSLDLQDAATIKAAVATALASFGKIDAWVNNAGYGVFGPVEAGTPDQIQRQYDVNVFGLIQCVQAVAPHFRENRDGVIVNVSSVGGLMTVPGYSIYNSSKFAVEGLSEGLWFELGTFGIRVKLIEPGVIRTNFSGRSMEMLDTSALPDYSSFMEKLKIGRAKFIKSPGSPELVANAIFRATMDKSDRLRYIVGADAARLWRLRRWFGYRTQMRIARSLFNL